MMISSIRKAGIVEEYEPFELITLWDEAHNHIEKRCFDRAVEIYKYVLLMYPDRPIAAERANAALGGIYFTLRQPVLAEEYILKAIEYNSINPGYHYTLGYVRALQNNWQNALNEFELAVSSAPQNPQYLRGLGFATFKTGNTRQGILILNKALCLQPDSIDILTDLAIAYEGLSDFRNSRKYVNMALKVDPQSSTAKGTLWLVDYAEHQSHLEDYPGEKG